MHKTWDLKLDRQFGRGDGVKRAVELSCEVVHSPVGKEGNQPGTPGHTSV